MRYTIVSELPPGFVDAAQAYRGLPRPARIGDLYRAYQGRATPLERERGFATSILRDVARANKYFDILDKPEFETRMTTEEFAVDSYQNLLFSLLRFYLTIQRWPNHISLVSHDFKKRRFIELHCPAVCWPGGKFTFVGIDPPQDVISREQLDFGEYNRGYGSFEKDPYGAHTYLRDKREARGWTTEQLQKFYQSSIPTTVKWLLLWEGGDTWTEMFQNPLPWDFTLQDNSIA